MKKFISALLFVVVVSIFVVFVREKVSVDRYHICEDDNGHPGWNGSQFNG